MAKKLINTNNEERQIDELAVDEHICRLTLQGKDKTYIRNSLMRKGLTMSEADKYVKEWFKSRDSLSFDEVKQDLCKFLMTAMADCENVEDRQGSIKIARLLTRTLGTDPNKDSQKLNKLSREQGEINTDFKLTL